MAFKYKSDYVSYEDKLHYWALSYCLYAEDLFCKFPHHQITLKNKDVPPNYMDKKDLFARMFRYLYYLIIKDVIQNQVSFKMPPGAERTWIEMVAQTGEDFKRIRQNGGFQDVDFLASNFTGYMIYLRYNTKYGKWLKRIYVSRKWKQMIADRTNKGLGW